MMNHLPDGWEITLTGVISALWICGLTWLGLFAEAWGSVSGRGGYQVYRW